MNKRRKYLILILSVALTAFLLCCCIGSFSVWYVLRPWNSDVNYLKGENVEITSFDDIKLVGNKHYAEEITDNWIILVHCYRGSKSTMSVYEKHYHENGYNTLCVDNRAHGQSEGDYIGMGYLDQFDIKAWVEYIVKENPDAKIVLQGLSMGGASCLIYSGRDDVSKNVVAVVNDSGYVAADSYLSWKFNQSFNLPSFPIVQIANLSAKLAAGYYLSDASALNSVENSDIPTLFIHCDNDMTVPVDDAYKLYNAANCLKDILIIEDAGHGDGVYKNPKLYWEKVYSFLEKVVIDAI